MTLQRKTPMKRTGIKRKATKPKRKPRAGTAPRCAVRGHDVPARVHDLCRKHAMAKADRLVREWHKNRAKWQCQCCGFFAPPGDSRIQWAHVIRRNQGRWVRHAPYGATVLCATCHTKFTHDEAAWVDWIDGHFGKDRHWRVRAIRNKREYDNAALEATLTRYGYTGRLLPEVSE